jgi:hypothetical protein
MSHHSRISWEPLEGLPDRVHIGPIEVASACHLSAESFGRMTGRVPSLHFVLDSAGQSRNHIPSPAPDIGRRVGKLDGLRLFGPKQPVVRAVPGPVLGVGVRVVRRPAQPRIPTDDREVVARGMEDIPDLLCASHKNLPSQSHGRSKPCRTPTSREVPSGSCHTQLASNRCKSASTRTRSIRRRQVEPFET